jgi:hypothetical protein
MGAATVYFYRILKPVQNKKSFAFDDPHFCLQFARFYPLRFAAFYWSLLIAASGRNAIPFPPKISLFSPHPTIK